MLRSTKLSGNALLRTTARNFSTSPLVSHELTKEQAEYFLRLNEAAKNGSWDDINGRPKRMMPPSKQKTEAMDLWTKMDPKYGTPKGRFLSDRRTWLLTPSIALFVVVFGTAYLYKKFAPEQYRLKYKYRKCGLEHYDREKRGDGH